MIYEDVGRAASDPDRALRAAAEALVGRPRCSCPDDRHQPTPDYCAEHGNGEWPPAYKVREAQKAVSAYLKALLGEIPEEAVAWMESAYLNANNALDARDDFREAARAFLRSLLGCVSERKNT